MRGVGYARVGYVRVYCMKNYLELWIHENSDEEHSSACSLTASRKQAEAVLIVP